MSISFACPECRAQIEVGDEFAGHDGQCPRCQQVIVIPSPTQPQRALAEAVPAPREAARARPRTDEAEEPRARQRRRGPAPKQPSGPIWPWLVGVFAAFVMAGLLISSFAVLVFWRRAEPIKTVPLVGNNRVTVGRLEGNRASMHNGVFQLRSELSQIDPFDPQVMDCRIKRFEIDLIRGRSYILEQDSQQFDCYLRVENRQGRVLLDDGIRGRRNAFLQLQPEESGIHIVYASSVDPGLGNFTLTIREQNRLKPALP